VTREELEAENAALNRKLEQVLGSGGVKLLRALEYENAQLKRQLVLMDEELCNGNPDYLLLRRFHHSLERIMRIPSAGGIGPTSSALVAQEALEDCPAPGGLIALCHDWGRGKRCWLQRGHLGKHNNGTRQWGEATPPPPDAPLLPQL
jgi:hypothetical protein